MRKVTKDIPTKVGRYILKEQIDAMLEGDAPVDEDRLKHLKDVYDKMDGRDVLALPDHEVYQLGLLKV